MKKVTRFFLMAVAVASLSIGANAQAPQGRAQQDNRHERIETNNQHKVSKDNARVAQPSKKSVGKSNSKKGGFRTTTAVKLRKHASSNTHSIKDRNGNNVVIPKGARLTYVDSKGKYYKVTYKGYTGYVPKKYTTGR